ncbi:MAG TPA: YggS family pyridoxal phosphate-dependent enzyme [Ignavibacteriaceae bacterium]|nr:YggS family pyridoxal phosphate-dependent enzyme [Ignavibacteriaceae bacterium]
MITENIKQVWEKINRKCAEIGRNPQEIRLIAVSKNFGTDEINEAINGGLNDFGENKAQELISKFEVLGNKITWHFIGHLQKNKVKFAVGSADYIHSVDSLSLANEINKRAEQINKIQKILLQVKTTDEETKSGIENEEEVFKIAEACVKLKNIETIGLMTIAPFTENEVEIRNSFRYLCKLRNDFNKRGFKNIKELSMGMTSDYEIAIEEGATMLRIGSAIFGQRDYSKELKK